MLTMAQPSVIESFRLINEGLWGWETGDAFVCLVKENFNPALVVDASDLVEADYTDYARIAPDDAPLMLWDDIRKQYLGRAVPPVGGFFWEVLTTPLADPQTIYGYFVLSASFITIGFAKFDSPVVLQAVGTFVSIPDVTIPYSKFAFQQDPIPG